MGTEGPNLLNIATSCYDDKKKKEEQRPQEALEGTYLDMGPRRTGTKRQTKDFDNNDGKRFENKGSKTYKRRSTNAS